MSAPVPGDPREETLREAVDSYRAILNAGVSRRADYLTEDDIPAYAALDGLAADLAEARKERDEAQAAYAAVADAIENDDPLPGETGAQ